MPKEALVAKDMNLHARLKRVGDLYARGYSATRIARDLDYDLKTANKDIACVIERYQEHQDFDKFLADATQRIREQLSSLSEQETALWDALEFAKERVVQTGGYGEVIYEMNDNGERNDEPLYGPRFAGRIPGIVGQLQSITKQKAELIGILNKNVDITVNLQRHEVFQVRLLEVIKDASPEIYTKLLRELKAAQATFGSQPALPKASRSLDEVIEGEYETTR
jgi:hypothetical protein